MGFAIYSNGRKFFEEKFNKEDDFEEEIKNNSKLLFGEKTIYLDIKKKIDTSSLGSSIPDGILFDFEDPEDIKFYLVEVELAKHDFYRHIFPQITKFFAFYKNSFLMNNLIEKIFSFINDNPKISKKFKELSQSTEIYKTIKDSIENNQNILLIIDEEKPELKEIMETYTDTWDKFVLVEILRKYSIGEESLFVLDPDFTKPEEIISKQEEATEEIRIKYTEAYHLDNVSQIVKDVYIKIKEYMWGMDQTLVFNPQKYYISIRDQRNFAYFHIRKKKVKLAVMLPYERGQEIVFHHRLRRFTEGIERFYGGPSFEVTIGDLENIEEIFILLKEVYERQKE